MNDEKKLEKDIPDEVPIDNQEIDTEAVAESADKAETEADGKAKGKKKGKEKKDKSSKELDSLKEELADQKEKYVRLAAEYDNYRRRTANEKLSIYSDATAKAIENLLPVADSLNMAMGLLSEDVPEEYKKGIDMIAQQFASSLEKMDVESFGEAGDEFDPELHNAVSKIEDENFSENTISLVFQKGFKIGDKIIRHAMVQVAN